MKKNKTTCTVGKIIFLMALMATTGVLQAQHCDSIPNHLAGHYCLWPGNAIQLADGNILIECKQDSLTTNDANQEFNPYLVKYYKTSRYGAAIMDSIFFEDTNSVAQDILEQLHKTDIQEFSDTYPGALERMQSEHPELIEAERHIVVLSFLGFRVKEEAELLGLSTNTVTKYRTNIRKKTNYNSVLSLSFQA